MFPYHISFKKHRQLEVPVYSVEFCVCAWQDFLAGWTDLCADRLNLRQVQCLLTQLKWFE